MWLILRLYFVKFLFHDWNTEVQKHLHAVDRLLIPSTYTEELSDDLLVLRVHYSAQMLWSAFPELLLT
jgi:hypothetical protein